MADSISFKLNDKPVRLNVDGHRALLWVLRTDLGLTGTKFGCGEGHCGACTVLVNGMAVRSCLWTARQVSGKEVVTIEGLAKDGTLHPIQKAFMEHDALQCGFCTPGMILTAYEVLKANPNPTREQIIRGMEHNFCRCGAQTRIIDAIQSAAAEMRGSSRDQGSSGRLPFQGEMAAAEMKGGWQP
jgi:aerobic-type carbon monoxide dehydrogenase small subunit (CoxS/CutS family)